MASKSLLDYYQQSGFNPVPIPLAERKEWLSHRAKRQNLYERHLGVPLALLRDKQVLEFGCNSGENAAVLASFGARLTLAEPNSQVFERLFSTFKNLGLVQQIVDLVETTLEEFHSDKTFDLVIAEGFLYTLPNKEAMLRKILGFVKPGSLGVISFNDLHGCFLEMLRRAVLKRSCQLSRIDDWSTEHGLATAQRLFQADFQLLNASRPFDAWWRDTLINPFVTYDHLWDYERVLAVLASVGGNFWACSPRWISPQAFAWYKNVPTRQAVLEEVRQHWTEQFLYFIFGTPSKGHARSVDKATIEESESVTKSWSEFSLTGDIKLIFQPTGLFQFLAKSEDVHFVQLAREIEQVVASLLQDSADVLRNTYHSATLLRRTWGAPYHYLAFQRDGEVQRDS
jgi:SAM-dependent methyltransferase